MTKTKTEQTKPATMTALLKLPTMVPEPADFAPLVEQHRGAAGIVIRTPADYERGAIAAKEVRGAIKRVQDFFGPAKSAALSLHRMIVAMEAKFLTPLDTFKRELDNKLLFFQREQERARRDEEARLQKLADEKAARDRAKLEAKSEKAASKGDEEKAAELAEQAAAVTAAPVIVQSAVPTVKGVATIKRWTVQAVDVAVLAAAATTRPELVGYLLADETALRKAKTANPLITVPGVTFIQTESLSGRAM